MIYVEKDPSLKSLLLQEALAARGLYLGELDNWWGGKSETAYQRYRTIMAPEGMLRGRVPGWEFIHARVEGDDIIIEDAIVTAFGGDSDQMDSGETASGISTAHNPNFLGCALPMRRDVSPALAGSPIPKLPWHLPVVFTDPKTRASVRTELIDEGPAKWTGHAGDLTVKAARFFDPAATANHANLPRMTIRVIGGAKYV